MLHHTALQRHLEDRGSFEEMAGKESEEGRGSVVRLSVCDSV